MNKSNCGNAPFKKHTSQISSVDLHEKMPINFEYDDNKNRPLETKHSTKRAEIPSPSSYDKGKEKKQGSAILMN